MEEKTIAEDICKAAPHYKDVFTQKEYVKIIAANIISRFGDSVDAIAFTWLVYSCTGSAAWSALIFGINMLPTIFIQPFAGALVEGMDKKKVMVVTDFIRGGIVAGLAVLYMLDLVNPWILVSMTLVNSSVEAFCLPAAMAIVPKVLEEKYYEVGTSLNSTLITVMQLVGMAAAGLIIGLWGIGAAILIDAVSFVGSALIHSLLKLKEEHLRREKIKVRGYLEILKEGAVYLKNQPVIRNFCMMGIVINAVIVPLNALQTPLVREVLGGGSELLSFFSLTLTIGMGLGSLLFPRISRKTAVNPCIACGGILLGFCMSAYVFTGWADNVTIVYILTGLISLLLGAAASIISAALNVQFMKVVKQDYMARVGSIFNALTCAATPVASFLVSGMATVFSVQKIFIGSAALCVLLFMYIAIRKVRLE
ncbi:MAG: MFS transporter [Lachnospiraceae bacterium]